MQYLISVINDTDSLATPDEDAAIDAFNDRLKADSHWVFAGGLGSPSSATVIDNRGGEAMFTDGPSALTTPIGTTRPCRGPGSTRAGSWRRTDTAGASGIYPD
jgi:hypothetical protein